MELEVGGGCLAKMGVPGQEAGQRRGSGWGGCACLGVRRGARMWVPGLKGG